MRIQRTAGSNKIHLTVSKTEWTKIGLSKKWLKLAEPVQTSDGKWIDEINGEIVEVPAPVTAMKDITVEIRDVPYIFEVGKTYSDHAGKYMVEEIKDGGKTLKVKYIDGRFQSQTREYSTVDRAKVIHNEVTRRDQANRIKTMGFNGNKEYFAIGYLAKNGVITAELPPSERKYFEEVYRALTGDNAINYLKSEYQIVKEDSKWHLELRIRFPEPDDAVLSKMAFKYVSINRIQSGLQINNNQFIFNLFKIGFKLSRQNVEDIRRYIPEKYMGDFNAGALV